MKKWEGTERRITLGQFSSLNWLKVGSKEPVPYTGKDRGHGEDKRQHWHNVHLCLI